MSKDQNLWAKLDTLGEDEVRLRVAKGIYGESKLPLVNEWLRRREAGKASAPKLEVQTASTTTPEPSRYDRVLRWLKNSRLVVGLLLLAVVVGGVAKFRQDICSLLPGLCGITSTPVGSPTVPPSSQQPTSAPIRRVFTTRSPRELLSLFEGRTILQGDRLMEPYKGLWISVQAETSMIVPDTSGITVVLMSGKDRVNARFDDRWRPALGRVKKGDTIRLRGKIATVQNGQQLYLLDSEFTD